MQQEIWLLTAFVDWYMGLSSSARSSKSSSSRSPSRSAKLRTSFIASCVVFSAKDVQTAYAVKHELGVNAVVPGVGTHLSRYRARHIALVVKYVVELKRQSGCVAFEEALRNLRVPYKFVRIH